MRLLDGVFSVLVSLGRNQKMWYGDGGEEGEKEGWREKEREREREEDGENERERMREIEGKMET